MLTTLIDLNRREYLEASGKGQEQRLDFVGARYKNVRYKLTHNLTHTISEADRANLPGIAFRYYGDVGYWWIIAMYNGIIDPIGEIVPPRILGLPSQASINAMLSESVLDTVPEQVTF